MLSFVQKLLEISMRMDKNRWTIIRIFGKILGIFPVWYSERLARKIFQGGYDPTKRDKKAYRNRKYPKKRCSKKRCSRKRHRKKAD